MPLGQPWPAGGEPNGGNGMKMHWKKRLLGVLLLAAAVLGVWSGYQSKYGLSLSQYTVRQEKITQSVRLVQISDLHNREFGLQNSELTARIRALEPDLIIVCGDLLNDGESSTRIAEELIASLCRIAPTYVSLGNHEVEFQRKTGIDLCQVFREAGAVVLERSWVDLEIHGQCLRIGGLYGYCVPERYLETGEADAGECDFLRAFRSTERYCILLSHMPVCWMENGGLSAWGIDCVLAGHAHGGQVRIPWIGGLWAPDQGWFPGRESGVYEARDGSNVMILSRGLGSAEAIPRWNNIPEIVAVDLVPA